MNHIRLESCHCLLQRLMIEHFELLQFAVASHQRMAERAVEVESPLDITTFLLVADAVRGGQHVDLMAARAKGLNERLAAHVIGAGVVRRVEVDENENLHDSGKQGMEQRQGINELLGQ